MNDQIEDSIGFNMLIAATASRAYIMLRLLAKPPIKDVCHQKGPVFERHEGRRSQLKALSNVDFPAKRGTSNPEIELCSMA